MSKYVVFKWRSRTPFNCELNDRDLSRFKTRALKEYEVICKKYRRAVERLNVLTKRAKRLKTFSQLLLTEFGERKAKNCPCHIITGRIRGNVICLARMKDWPNSYRGGEFYFWICSHCKIPRGYRETKAMVRKLEGEYKKFVLVK